MASPIEKHQNLIEHLKRLLTKQDFPDHFSRITKDVDQAAKLKIKSELKRLARKCRKNIDLRGQTQHVCDHFFYADMQHYLDKQAVVDFNQAIDFFGGQYTTGVFEHVMNNLKNRQTFVERYQKPPVPTLILGHSFERKEERIRFSIDIQAYQDKKEKYSGITTDLSLHGLRIRLQRSVKIDLNQPLSVCLHHIGAEILHKELQVPISYQILDHEQNNEHQWLQLARLNGTQKYDDLLMGLINSHKHKYKADVEDVIHAVNVMNYERCFLPFMGSLPVFFSDLDSGCFPLYALTNPYNKKIIDYFRDPTQGNFLSSIFTQTRMKRLMNDHIEEHQLWFCFRFKKNTDLYYYVATLYELNQSKLKHLFFHFASKKSSWRVFHLSLKPKDDNTPLHRFALNQEDTSPSALVENQIHEVKWILNMTDLTENKARKNYQAYQSDKDPNLLKKFLMKMTTKEPIDEVQMDYFNMRKESRFELKMAVLLKQDKNTYRGLTNNISAHGLHVIFKEPIKVNSNKRIYLDFPNLDPQFPHHRLQRLPYRVVEALPKSLRLEAIDENKQHQGVQVLNKILKTNEEKLKTIKNFSQEHQSMYEALKNIFFQYSFTNSFFMHKNKNKTEFDLICHGKQRNQFLNTLHVNHSHHDGINIYDILNEDDIKKFIINPARKKKKDDACTKFEVFIDIRYNAYFPFIENTLINHGIPQKKQKEFILNAEKCGQFLALSFSYYRYFNNDSKFFTKEMAFIRKNSPSNANALETKFRNTQVQGEIIDITFEIKQRFNIS